MFNRVSIVKNKGVVSRILENAILCAASVVVCMLPACDDSIMETVRSENESAGSGIRDCSWNKIGNVATPRSGAAFALHEGKIYVYGGEDGSGVLEDFWRYDLSTGAYESLSSPDGSPGCACSDFVILGDRLYLFGGRTSSGLSRDLFCFDTKTDEWSVTSGPSGFNGTTPSARYSHVTLSYISPSSSEEFIFVHGGYKDGSMADGALYILTELSAAKPRWSKTDIGMYSGGHAGALIDDRIYFFGGYNSDTSEYSGDMHVYNIDTGVLTSLHSGDIGPRSGMRITGSGAGFFTYGGIGESGCLGDEWFYTVKGTGLGKI